MVKTLPNFGKVQFVGHKQRCLEGKKYRSFFFSNKFFLSGIPVLGTALRRVRYKIIQGNAAKASGRTPALPECSWYIYLFQSGKPDKTNLETPHLTYPDSDLNIYLSRVFGSRVT